MLDVVFFMRRCGFFLFHISTFVTITITRKEFVINFLMFKHNIFLLLVFVFFFSQRPVLYCFFSFVLSFSAYPLSVFLNF